MNQMIWGVNYEINNILLKIKDYKRSKNMSLNTPIFHKLLTQIIGKNNDELDEKLMNILKIEEKDDSIQIAMLNSFIKIFKSHLF